MAAPVKLRIVLGENSSQRLTLKDGIPDTVCELVQHIKRQCGVEAHFRLQFMDAEFGNEFTNLTSMSEIQDKSTLKLVYDSAAPARPDDTPPPSCSAPATSCSESSFSSGSSYDTDILSTPESTPSRSSGWPLVFVVPRFPYDCELQLEKANCAFKESGTLLNLDIRLKTAILDSLAEAIVQYKVYPLDKEFEEVAEALVSSHPCLKEPGSATGYGGWKVSLKYKLANYRRNSFAHRRQEVIRDAPLIADFKTKWPALFCVRELTAEFKRITTVSLLPKFFGELDAHSSDLMRVFGKKGGLQGRKIKNILIPITQTDDIHVKRLSILKGLCVYLNEEPDKFVKKYVVTDEGQRIEAAIMETMFGIFVIRHEGAEPDDDPEDVVIVLEGVRVLEELGNVPLAVVMILALVYALNLSYPPELRYTFEALQKIIMELDGNRLSKKIQALKTHLARHPQ